MSMLTRTTLLHHRCASFALSPSNNNYYSSNKTVLLRWAHSHAPKTVVEHLDMIRRHADAFPDKFRPNNDLPQHLEKESVQKALRNFEVFSGIEPKDVQEMLQYAPKDVVDESILERLLTWKDIRHQEDLFLEGLGSFDVSEIFRMVDRDYDYFADGFDFSRDIDTLKTCILDILDSSGEDEDHCWQRFFSGTATDNQCGGEHLDLFWLPAVADLQSTAYFSDDCYEYCKCSDCLRDFFRYVLSLPEKDPWRRHLLQYRDYWNDPDNIEVLFQCYYCTADDVWKMMGDDLPPPERLEEALELAKQKLYRSGEPKVDN